ncbi:MAG TPA: hypothetical protein VML96_06710, partial [Egibacteraceae bacterium]|nr:hypothetical protein [Egibacteraceae bacterium]
PTDGETTDPTDGETTDPTEGETIVDDDPLGGGGLIPPPTNSGGSPTSPGTTTPTSPGPTTPTSPGATTPTSPAPSQPGQTASSHYPVAPGVGSAGGTGADSAQSAAVVDETAVLSAAEQGPASVGAGSGILNSLRRLQAGVFGGGSPAEAGVAQEGALAAGEDAAAAGGDDAAAAVLTGASRTSAASPQPWWQAVLIVGLGLLAADVAVYMAAQRGRIKVKRAQNL